MFLKEWFDHFPNNLSAVEVDMVRTVDFRINEVIGIRTFVNVDDFHRDVSIFVETSSVGFDDEVWTFDVRRELLECVSRVAVKTGDFLTQISRKVE